MAICHFSSIFSSKRHSYYISQAGLLMPFCLNIHTWAFESDSCEERQSPGAPAEAAQRCDPWHNRVTSTGGDTALLPTRS